MTRRVGTQASLTSSLAAGIIFRNGTADRATREEAIVGHVGQKPEVVGHFVFVAGTALL